MTATSYLPWYSETTTNDQQFPTRTRKWQIQPCTHNPAEATIMRSFILESDKGMSSEHCTRSQVQGSSAVPWSSDCVQLHRWLRCCNGVLSFFLREKVTGARNSCLASTCGRI